MRGNVLIRKLDKHRLNFTKLQYYLVIYRKYLGYSKRLVKIPEIFCRFQ